MEATSAAWRWQGTYRAERAQVGRARRALAQALDGHPASDDATLIASEFATNAILHSASGDGGKFTLRAEIRPATAITYQPGHIPESTFKLTHYPQVRTDTSDLARVVTIIGQDRETIANGGSGDEQIDRMDAGSLT
jgi:hypothetical protein